MQPNLNQLVELQDEFVKLEMNWYRHLLTLSAGALVLLGSLVSDTPSPGIVRYLLAATWVFLGIGILSGAGATYVAVNHAHSLAQKYAEELINSWEGKATNQIISATTSKFLERCRLLMLISLLSAVVCLTSYSVMATLTA